jgi:exopolysaccharide production protein ExoY
MPTVCLLTELEPASGYKAFTQSRRRQLEVRLTLKVNGVTLGVQPLSIRHFESQARRAQNELLVWKLIGIAERIAAAALLLILLPALFAAAVIVILRSRRSPLIAHRRVGRNRRTIWVLKLRTMWSKHATGYRIWPLVERVSCHSVPQRKRRFDDRVTSGFAALCRRYSLDELPQLWNVVRGEMSLVGPRPLTQAEIAEYYDVHAALLLEAKPGITGLWQVKGRSRLTYGQRLRLDLFMLRNWSPRLYVFILAATVPRVLTGVDAW